MPLSEQERRCIDLACRYLAEHYGDSWSVEEYLDDLNPSEPTPEVIAGNGQKRAAIEVKRLTGDALQQEYVASLRSNEKYLTPSCGGSYYLNPPVDFRLPMDRALRRLVKREIERVAPTLSPGQKGAIRIPRRGHVSLISESGPAFIYCLHQGPGAELMSALKDKITGMFMLVDERLEHSFVTQECRAAFEKALTTPGWELTGGLRTNWIVGLHGTCPVVYFREQDLNSLYVLDVPRFATLAQFDPLVELHLETVDEARARRILEERPDLELDMVDTLRSMAHLRLYQSYEFEIHDRSAVWETKLSPH